MSVRQATAFHLGLESQLGLMGIDGPRRKIALVLAEHIADGTVKAAEDVLQLLPEIIEITDIDYKEKS